MAGGILSLKLGLNSKGFRTGLRVARSAVGKMRKNISKQFKASMKSFAAGFGMSFVKDQIAQTIEWAGNIDSLATKFGLTRKQVQGLEHALAATGMSVESGLGAFKKMQIFATRAVSEFRGANRKNELAWAFEKLGISIQDIETMQPYELFKKIGDNMSGAGIAGGELTEAVNTIFGGDGQAMLEAFNGGLTDTLNNFEAMGGGVDDSTVAQLAEIGKQWDIMQVKMQQTKAESVGFFSQMGMGLYHIADVGAQAVGEWWHDVDGNIDFSDRFDEISNTRIKNYADQLYAQEQAEEARIIEEKRLQKINALADERANIAQKINDIEATQEERRFNALTDAQKQVELAKRLKEEEEARNKLGKMDDYGATDAGSSLAGIGQSLGLGTGKKEDMPAWLQYAGKLMDAGATTNEGMRDREGRNLERMEADEKVAKTQEELKSLKVEAAHKDYGGGIGSTFTNLSSIGGQLGAKSPLLTNAEKTLTLAEEQRKLLASIDKTMHIFGP